MALSGTNPKPAESLRRRQRRRVGSRPRTCWQLQTAKAQFSEVFRRARADGPQWVTRQDKEAVVIVSSEEFERLSGRARQPASLVGFFAESPLTTAGLELERVRDYGRDVEL